MGHREQGFKVVWKSFGDALGVFDAHRQLLGIEGCDPVYISVGRMIAYKDPLRILDIFMRNEKDRWAKIVPEAGIQPE